MEHNIYPPYWRLKMRKNTGKEAVMSKDKDKKSKKKDKKEKKDKKKK